MDVKEATLQELKAIRSELTRLADAFERMADMRDADQGAGHTSEQAT